MKAMKDSVTEVAALKRRAIRSFAMGRITEESCDFITTRLDEINNHIVEMEEKKEDR